MNTFHITRGKFLLSIKCVLLFSVLLFSNCPNIYCQEELQLETESNIKSKFGRFRYIDFKGHYGKHLYSGETAGDALNNYASFELRYAWQPSNPDNWTSQYGYISYGVGYYIGFIGDSNKFGTPNAIFTFINIPLSNPQRRNVFQISPAFGFTFNLEPYDAETNPDNDSVGGSVASYISLGIGAEYRLSDKWDLLYGFDFTHSSIARIYTPNFGYNMYGLNLGVRRYYNADQKKLNQDPNNQLTLPSRFKRLPKKPNTKVNEHSFEFYMAMGTAQNEVDKGTNKRYFAVSTVIDYKYKLNNAHGFTGGFDIFYDGSLENIYPEKRDQILTGVHLGYDFMISKLTIRLQGGLYLSEDKGKEPTYMRLALQYEITKWFYVQAGIKSKKGMRADWLEFGIGFKPFRW